MTDSSQLPYYVHNFRTGETEIVYEKDLNFRDLIPQTREALLLFDLLIGEDISEFEACREVLDPKEETGD